MTNNETPDRPASRPGAGDAAEGVYTTGSVGRHLLRMAAPASTALLFIFLVDVVTLFYISLLQDERLIAAVGLARFIEYFVLAIGLAFASAATVLVSQALGAGDKELAVRRATSCLVITVAVLCAAVGAVQIFRGAALASFVEPGAVFDAADLYLEIALYSVPLAAVSMAAGAILRGAGDVPRSVAVTVSGSLAALLVNPALIFWAGLGVEGAAWALLADRTISAALGIWFVVRVYRLLKPPDIAEAVRDARTVLAIAGPAALSELAPPTIWLLATAWVAAFGDSALAAWAVIARITLLAGCGILGLTVALNPVLGQNYGAGEAGRTAASLRNAMTFSICYVIAAWALFASTSGAISRMFDLTPEASGIVRIYALYGFGAIVLASMSTLCRPVFYHFGRSFWTTALDWLANALTLFALILLVGLPDGERVAFALGASAAVCTVLIGRAIAGAFSLGLAWYLVAGVGPPEASSKDSA